MPNEVDSMEVILLDELASTVETIWLTDVQIRECVASRQWAEGRYLSALLLDLLQEKRIPYEAIRQKLSELGHAHPGKANQIQRCSDMLTQLFSVTSKYLPIYARIVVGFSEKMDASSASSLQENRC